MEYKREAGEKGKNFLKKFLDGALTRCYNLKLRWYGRKSLIPDETTPETGKRRAPKC